MRAKAVILAALCLGPPASAQERWALDEPVDAGPTLTLATSADGLTWTESHGPFMRNAAAAEIVMLERQPPGGDDRARERSAGTVLLYAMNSNVKLGALRAEMSVLVSGDGGLTWGPPRKVEFVSTTHVSPLLGAHPVAPSVVQLEDGRLRMYFCAESIERRPVLPDGEARAPTGELCSAVSLDGATFTIESGVRIHATGLRGADVARTGAGYLAAWSDGKMVHVARSKDGLRFDEIKVEATLGIGPCVCSAPQGQGRLTFCTPHGVRSVVVDSVSGAMVPDVGRRIADDSGRVTRADAACRADGVHLMVISRRGAPPRRESNSIRPMP